MTRDSELIVVGGDRIYHLGLSKEQLSSNVLICGDPKRADLIASYFDPGSLVCRVQNREFTTRTGAYRGLPVTVIMGRKG